jgi:hypothetical protein
VFFAELRIVEIVRGSDLERATAKLTVHVLVSDDRNDAAYEREHGRLATQVRVAFVLGMHGHCRVAEERLRPGRGNHELGGSAVRVHYRLAALFDDLVAQVPEVALAIGRDDFEVRECRLAAAAPVDDAARPDRSGFPRAGARTLRALRLEQPSSIVKRSRFQSSDEPEALELVGDLASMVVLPLPSALQELLAPQVMASERAARGALAFLCDLLFDLGLGRDPRVVGAREPEGVIALHAAPANERVLNGIGERVAHVQHAGDVGRRDDDAEGFLPWCVCVEASKQPSSSQRE